MVVVGYCMVIDIANGLKQLVNKLQNVMFCNTQIVYFLTARHKLAVLSAY